MSGPPFGDTTPQSLFRTVGQRLGLVHRAFELTLQKGLRSPSWTELDRLVASNPPVLNIDGEAYDLSGQKWSRS